MTTTRTTGTGLIVLEDSISIKNTPTLRDWPRRLLDGRERRANQRESRKSKATRSCMRGCRGNMRSIWHEQRVKRKRLGRVRSAGTRRGAPLLFMVALPLAAQSWATVTSPGQRLEVQCRRWWTWCCTVWTERTWRCSGKCSGSSRRCGTLINLPSAVKLGWRRRTSSGSWIQSQLCHRSSTDWPTVWGLKV